MEPLKTNRLILTWLSVYRAKAGITRLEKSMHILVSLTVFFGIMGSLLGSIGYFWKFVVTDLEASLYALSQIAAAFNMAYAIVVTFFARQGFTSILQKLTHIYEKSKEWNSTETQSNSKTNTTHASMTFIYNSDKDDDSFQFLDRCNSRCEMIWKYYFEFMMGGFFVVMFSMSTLSTIFNWLLHGDFDANKVFHPNKFL